VFGALRASRRGEVRSATWEARDWSQHTDTRGMPTVVNVGVVGDNGPLPETMGATNDDYGREQLFSLAHFVRTTFLQLMAATAVLVVGSAVALNFFDTTEEYRRDNINVLFQQRTKGLVRDLQFQIDSFEVGVFTPSFHSTHTQT